jgi:hypothetical protein
MPHTSLRRGADDSFPTDKTTMKILLTTAAIAISALTAHAQLFVVSNFNDNIVTRDPVTGAPINANLISGLSNPLSIASFQGALYVANNNPGSTGKYALDGTPITIPFIYTHGGFMSISSTEIFVSTTSNTVGKFNPTDGTVVNASFITGLNNPQDILRSGNTLYITNYDANTVGTYAADTGAVINAALISGLNGPTALALSGNTLYVGNYGNNTVRTYNATTGVVINASLISGLSYPSDLVIFGGYLYVCNRNSGVVGKYNLDGTVVNATLASGLFDPSAIAVVFDKSKAIDLGVISDTTTDYATPDRTTHVNLASARDVIWYKFTISENADLASTRFFDIATRPNIPSTLTNDDTEIAIYNSDGQLVATNDDGGVSGYSQLSFNPNVAPRGPLTATGFNTDAAASGQDGTLPAGTYYLAVADFNAIFDTSEFDVTGNGADTGTFNLEFRTDIPIPNRAPTVAVNAKSIKPTTKSKLKIAGTTTDADGDALKVFVKVGKAGFRPAKVSGSSWTFTARLAVGKNSVQVYAIDGDGLSSATRKFKIIRRP